MDNDRVIKLINDDDGAVVNATMDDIERLGLMAEMEVIERQLGKAVTGISLEVSNIRQDKPSNLGFSFD